MRHLLRENLEIAARDLVNCNINLAFKSGEPFDSAQGERSKEFRSW